MISFIVPTLGRPSLARTLRSIECWQGDEIIVVSENVVVTGAHIRNLRCPRGNDFGHSERNFAQMQARGQYVAHIDDDDWYVPGARAIMQQGIEQAAGRPVMFRMQFPCGITLWREPKIYCGNVGTPMFLMPNKPEMFGTWGSYVGGDCGFLETSKFPLDNYLWRPEIIAMLDHNPGAPQSPFAQGAAE